MQCPHFDAGECRSCPLMGVPHPVQVADQQRVLRELLDPVTGPDVHWHEPLAGPEAGFRNKAKMVVTGSAQRPLLGILDPRQHPRHHDGTGVDLRDCGLYEPGIATALPLIARTVTTAGLPPYDIASRTGELKHVIVTVSPDAELMVRFVLRSTDTLPQLRRALPELQDSLAAAGVPARVITANILPEHQALLEGPEEIHLAGAPTLTMRVNGLPLNLRPQGFFQTNTPIAAELYAHASAWLDTTDARSVWDLYCGVGGFGLQLAEVRTPGGPLPVGTPREVWGLETSADAVAAAQVTAEELGLADRVRFAVGDATQVPTTSPHPGASLASLPRPAEPGGREGDLPGELPGAVVVNPPRRGIGEDLADWLEGSGIPHVLYSSCNATTLARDLARMPTYRAVQARMLDMFPQTAHHEVLVQLARR